MFHMKQWKIEKTLKDIVSQVKERPSASILVVGDIILDHYQYGKVERISPEAPVPIVLIQNEEYKLGGAANVANNLSALGEHPHLIGVVGKDLDAKEIEGLVKQKTIPCNLISSDKCPTIKKTRIIAQNQQVLRLDREVSNTSHWDIVYPVLSKFKDKFELIIISDYGKGVVGRELLEELSNWKTLLLIDPKKRNFNNYKGCFLLTPNRKEAEELSGVVLNNRESIIEAGRLILKKTNAENLLITLGSEGMVLFESGGGDVFHLPAISRRVFDVTGAGDTVLSAIALGLSKGLSLIESCVFANICAGIVVGKVGTSVVLWEDIEPLNGKWESYLKLNKWV